MSDGERCERERSLSHAPSNCSSRIKLQPTHFLTDTVAEFAN